MGNDITSAVDTVFLAGGGEMGALMRAHDWSTSPLGLPEAWPQSLRSALQICLNMPIVSAVHWGPDLRILYNDAYAPALAERHPWALGRPFGDVWTEIWNVLGPQIATVIETGRGFSTERQLLKMDRHDRLEDTYWIYSFAPLHDDDGAVAGIFVTALDETEKVLTERRQAFMLELGDRLRTLVDAGAIMQAAAEALGGQIGADRAGYAEVTADDRTFVVERDWSAGDMASFVGRHRLDDFGPDLIAEFRAGRPVTFEDVLTEPLTAGGDVAEAFETITLRAAITVPLIKAGRFAAALYAHSRTPRRWTREDESLVREVAERTWGAVERARAEAELRESGERLRLATDNAEIGFWDVDVVNDILIWPPRTKAMFGIPESAAVSMADFYAGLHPEDREATGAAYAAAADPVRRALYDVEYRTIGKDDGVVRWVAAKGRGVFDTTGRCLRVTGTAIDITERRATEAALGASEARYRALFDAIDSGFCVIEVIFDEHGKALDYKFVEANPAFERQSGLTGVVGRRIREFAPDLEEVWFERYGRVALTGKSFRVEDEAAPLGKWFDINAFRVGAREQRRVAVLVNDMTARRKAEERLRELNADLERQVVERTQARGVAWQVTPDLMGALNAEGYFQTSNPAWCTMLGWSEEEIASMSIWQLLHADDVARTREGFALTQVGHPAIQFVNRYRCKDGSYRWLSWVGVPEAGLVYCTGRDITDEKAREAELAERTAERDRLWELSPDLLTVVDYEGRLLRVNPSWTRVLGYDEERLLTRPYAEILHPDEIEAIAGLLVEMKSTGRPVLLEDRLLAADGTWRTFVWTLSPEHGGNRLYGVGRDVTEERVQAQALAERTAERDRMWETSPDLMLIISFDGVFRRVNEAWTTMLGYAPEELVGFHVNDFVVPDDHEKTTGAYELSAAGGRPVIENRYRHKDGSIRWISWTAAPAGNMTYATGRDVTSEKERKLELEMAQEALRQSQKMEAMGSLTGGVAHDFNNLLTPIVGALDMLQRRGLGGEREQRSIAGAMQSADRAKTLVQRLLAFARRQPLQPTAVDLTPLVRGMADLISSTTGPHIKIVVDAAEGLSPANADPNQLEMAILNLAVNARDAMPDGGTLHISIDERNFEVEKPAGLKPGRYLRLSVADTGDGMDEATLKRAVEPFFSTKGVGKGTGLGLSMVHGLASQLGGTLDIRSTPRIGTHVELWLPQSAEALAITEAPADVRLDAQGSGTALLVDDEEVVRLSTADMLVELGYAVVEAASAEDALTLLGDGLQPDLLVTDHLMPGMSGTELARLLQNSRPEIKVLIVSGYADADGIAADLPRLTKPFRNADLVASLAALT